MRLVPDKGVPSLWIGVGLPRYDLTPKMAKGGETGMVPPPSHVSPSLLRVDLGYFISPFAGSDPDCLLDRNHEDLAVSDLS
jgi:hypothetical protein